MNKFAGFSLLLLLTFSLACNKGEALRTHLCFTTQHHEKVIPDITIYIRYNSDVFPGFDPPKNFDTFVVSDSKGRVCIQDFPLGNHWFVGFGYDPEIREQVYGAMDIRFDLRNLKVDTVLYVGEE